MFTLIRGSMTTGTLLVEAGRCLKITNALISQSLPMVCVHLSEATSARYTKIAKERVVPPVSRANTGSFNQVPPSLGNVFWGDSLLVGYLKHTLPIEVFSKIKQDLGDFGERIGTVIEKLGRECEINPPQVKHFDAWGKRIDSIETCHAWKQMHGLSAEEGIIAIPYENYFGEWSRVYQAAKLCMYASSSGLYSCPLAMTDGAAKLIKDLPVRHAALQNAYDHLTSRDILHFWTSGQWMTEKKGGSDVANGTETIAVRTGDETFKLYGYKWFTSATDSEIAFTLARIVDEHGNVAYGSRGLSLFYLETRKSNGDLNNLEVQRLKNKLGTRQLPTAELLLDGTDALLVSKPGRGVAGITPMLTLTRLHNSIAAVSSMRRIIQYARDYATKRSAFGRTLTQYPLHMHVLAKMEVECTGAFLFTMEVFRLLGLSENGLVSEENDQLIRFLTPLLKLYTGKQAISVTSEGLESHGGQGYMEDTGLPTLFRDAQVLSIWEGTTNILSLDVLRTIAKTKGKVLEIFINDIEKKLAYKIMNAEIVQSRDKILAALNRLAKFMDIAVTKPEEYFECAARDFAYSAARIYIGSLIFEYACRGIDSSRMVNILKRWCMQDLTPVIVAMEAGLYDASGKEIDTHIVMAGYND